MTIFWQCVGVMDGSQFDPPPTTQRQRMRGKPCDSLRRRGQLPLPEREDAREPKVISFWREQGVICYALMLPIRLIG
jgi:hypothetical protein